MEIQNEVACQSVKQHSKLLHSTTDIFPPLQSQAVTGVSECSGKKKLHGSKIVGHESYFSFNSRLLGHQKCEVFVCCQLSKYLVQNGIDFLSCEIKNLIFQKSNSQKI